MLKVGWQWDNDDENNIIKKVKINMRKFFLKIDVFISKKKNIKSMNIILSVAVDLKNGPKTWFYIFPSLRA